MTTTSLSRVLFLAAFSGVAALAQPKYSIQYLGTLDARGVNDVGQVTGASYTPGDAAVHAFFYDGTMHDLGTLGGNGSVGFGINHTGRITGVADLPGSTHSDAFLYDGTMHDLGTLEGGSSTGLGINDAGQVVGYSYALTSGTPAFHGFFYDGTMHDLGLGEARGINNAGHATGWYYPSGSAARAFLYDGTIHDLGTLGGSGSVGYAISGVGLITGQAQTLGDTARHAFLYDGIMHDLSALGGAASIGFGINNAGQVVGSSDTPTIPRAFLYDGTTMYDLSNLVVGGSFSFASAFGINNVGQIVADDYLGQAYLLTPIGPPVIGNASASPDALWPPKHNFVDVTIGYTVTSSSPATCGLNVTSNEASNDAWNVLDAHHVLLLAERDGNGSGRIYTVAINCTNAVGASTANVTVLVRHDQGHR